MARYDPSSGKDEHNHHHGFVKCCVKKVTLAKGWQRGPPFFHSGAPQGVPKEKNTLVIRPLPPLPRRPRNDTPEAAKEYRQHVQMRKKFKDRGQIIGHCVRGAAVFPPTL